jgi:ribosomal protein S18 acetylase RimI-like enzyme
LAEHKYGWQSVAITDTGEIVGYTAIRLDKEGAAELIRHYVSPAYQRQGVGSHLLNDAIIHIKQCGPVNKIWLAVLRENPIGRSFYEKFGFVHEHDEGPHPVYGAHESYYVYTLDQYSKK